MTKSLHLGDLRIPITDYASQGNAILGIRDSGKSYTATWLAERLLEHGIPFVAFDPIGIWKYLRVAGKGKGYPVVVAGGRSGDLPLTPHSAPEIVRAAMRENLPLVLDLYSIQLSKADWKRIVEQSVRLLLYENGDHGLRHIFIEEAAEFCPQRIGPDQGAVYSEIEKLARMGGNALLGYTLINQRAEEVNKAVLELCDCLFLHRQKGRNSLTALSKWLDIGDVSNSRPIIQSLPRLPQGECWVWASGSDTPVRVHVPEKNTFHPDRRALSKNPTLGKGYNAIDVSAFVKQMAGTLEKVIAETQANDPARLRRQVADLEHRLATAKTAAPAPEIQRVEVPVLSADDYRQLTEVVSHARATAAQLQQTVNDLQQHASRLENALKLTRTAPPAARPAPASSPAPRSKIPRFPAGPLTPSRPMADPQDSDSAILRGERAILQALARCHPMRLTLSQIGRLAGQSLKSSTFKQYVRNVLRRGLIEKSDHEYSLTPAGMSAADFVPQAPQTYHEKLEMWRSALLAGERAIFDYVLQCRPEYVHVDTISATTGQSLKSSSFKQYLRNLKRNGLFDSDGDHVRISQTLFTDR